VNRYHANIPWLIGILASISAPAQAEIFSLPMPDLQTQYGGFIGDTFHESSFDFGQEFVSIEEAWLHIEGDQLIVPIMQLQFLGYLDGTQALPPMLIDVPSGEYAVDVPLIPPLGGGDALDGQGVVGLNINVLTCCDIPFVVTSATLFFDATPVASKCPADLDGTGDVGFSDLLNVITAWGPCALEGACAQDLDGDLIIGFSDLLIVITSWGPCT